MNRAKRFERDINRVNRQYLKTGQAYVYQNETQTLITNSGPLLLKSHLDYTGFVSHPHQFLMFDAKSTLSKTSLPLANIKQHQLVQMMVVAEMGGISGILVLDGDENVYWVSYERLCIETETRQSVSFKNIQDCKLEKLEEYINVICK